MQKKYFILGLLIISLLFIAAADFSNVGTTLIVIDEEENEKFLETTPFADGIFNALWELPYIFFDMRIETPLEFNNQILDYRPFVSPAFGGGADSILLIKINYDYVEIDKKNKLTIKQASYCFYSIEQKKIVTQGKIALNYEQFVSPSDKYKIIKKLGMQTLNQIYQ